MEIFSFGRIVSFFVSFLALTSSQIFSVYDINLIYNKGGDINIQNPVLMQAYYDELGGAPRNYVIESSDGFDLNLKLAVPASTNSAGRYSFKILAVEGDDKAQIDFVDGQTQFVWEKAYDPSTRDYYLDGPEYSKNLPAGKYEIQIFSYENRGKYVLTAGSERKFAWGNLLETYLLVPELKANFFETPAIEFLFTPFGIVLVFFGAILLLIVSLIILINAIAFKFSEKKPEIILLTSAGMAGSKEEIMRVLRKPSYNIKIGHIITASKPEEDKSYVEIDRQLMHEAGFNVEDIDIEGKNKSQLMQILSSVDIIYVQGGNTFFLLKQMRASGFDKIIKKLLKMGIVYAGVSAGSIVAGKSVKTALWLGDKNGVKIKNLSGLGLVPFNIFPHYTKDCDETIKKEQKKSWQKIMIISDTQCLLVQDGKTALLGTGEKVVY